MTTPSLKTSKDRVNIVFGPPGTGKTTTLLNLVEEAIHSGITPNRIAYLAFTRKAAHEAMDRAIARFGLSRDDFPYFRTFHSLAFKELGLSRSEVMTTEDYRNLGAALGCYTFQFQYDDTIERAPRGGGLGDRCLRLYSLAKATGKTLSEVRDQYEDPGIDQRGLEKFSAALDDYKRQTLKLDFTDFLSECGAVLDVDLFILDEAQDFTAQQWAFARQLSRNCPKIFIAGDDDQAIFQWAGADLRTFNSFKGARSVLPKSYRLPRRIQALAKGLSSRISHRYPKTWESREDEGEVGWIVGLEHLNMAEEEWMFLVRRRAQTTRLVDYCRNVGVVYQDRGRWSNDDPNIRAVLSYERLRRGETIPPGEAKRITAFSGAPASDATSYHWDSFQWPFEGRPDWMEALPGLPDRQREYIRLLRRNGESLTKPGRVILSTIHGSKGGEAENVVLFPKLNKRIQRSFYVDPDQEHRVWYVGASRASKRLFVVNEPAKFFYNLA
jgi:DNA helicase II / ATP-dependent DNA helicase PcrA